MRALELATCGPIGDAPLHLVDRPTPLPGSGQLAIRVSACAICRTDLQVVEGDLRPRRSPSIPGHQGVGRVSAVGPDVSGWSIGDRVGVGWLANTCGDCDACRRGNENLCAGARFTGWDVDGAYATSALVEADHAIRLPAGVDDQALAPLLCGGRDRLSSAPAVGDRARRAAWAVRVRGIGLPGHPGRPPLGLRDPCPDPVRGGPRSRARPRGDDGGRVRLAATGAGRGRHVRSLGRRRHRRAPRARSRPHGRDQRHPPRRHPGVSVRRPVVGARSAERRELHQSRCRRVPRACRRDPDPDLDRSVRAGGRRTRRSADWRTGRWTGRACWIARDPSSAPSPATARSHPRAMRPAGWAIRLWVSAGHSASLVLTGPRTGPVHHPWDQK